MSIQLSCFGTVEEAEEPIIMLSKEEKGGGQGAKHNPAAVKNNPDFAPEVTLACPGCGARHSFDGWCQRRNVSKQCGCGRLFKVSEGKPCQP